jgi:hypothetical protein
MQSAEEAAVLRRAARPDSLRVDAGRNEGSVLKELANDGDAPESDFSVLRRAVKTDLKEVGSFLFR